ncbi:hypothetical protein EYF80_049783 [Liparis tanakae]|uniref:Uncharacterized protein n=1 Tax=Liparis tanakae TaxID=230148 RepID=A0A4Z2FFV8_9TELE|nr:hypothetical protein EYF80_049783 [Liparis tanakae]
MRAVTPTEHRGICGEMAPRGGHLFPSLEPGDHRLRIPICFAPEDVVLFDLRVGGAVPGEDEPGSELALTVARAPGDNKNVYEGKFNALVYRKPPAKRNYVTETAASSLWSKRVVKALLLCHERESPAVPWYCPNRSRYQSLSGSMWKLSYSANTWRPCQSSRATRSLYWACWVSQYRCSRPSQYSPSRFPKPCCDTPTHRFSLRESIHPVLLFST